MQKWLFFILLLCLTNPGISRPAYEKDSSILLIIRNEKQEPVDAATIALIRVRDSFLVKTALTDEKGFANIRNIPPDEYRFEISLTGYQTYFSKTYKLGTPVKDTLHFELNPSGSVLQNITITGKKPLIERSKGKVLINVDAAVTNAGATVLEVLEKSPGVTVDRNGGISLQAKSGVFVFIDDKQTFLTGADLANLLSSMSASQVDQIELIIIPGAKYDANGNAGIINIKTKKNKQKGFNGSLSLSYGQGRYPKTNNSIMLNYRQGKFNSFFNYTAAYNENFVDIFALRSYFDATGKTIATLEQPTYIHVNSLNNTLKTGVDYYATEKTTFGIAFTGVVVSRQGESNAKASWLNGNGSTDSAIITTGNSSNRFRNGSINFNIRHAISKTQNISADFDWLNYDIRNEQYFTNQLDVPGGYTEASQGYLPSDLRILAGKLDYSLRFGQNGKLESGWKSSHINTDNLAVYHFYDGNLWSEDYGKSNHFLYQENIHALYSSLEQRFRRFTFQAGLRYEYTAYNANQLGNALKDDSSFSKKYSGLFPSGYISFQADSSNAITLTAGRRIDRPPYQKLNPFVFIINKYTYQTGNPFLLPQYSWNIELGHQYKNFLTTAISYSIIKNYFTQLFLTNNNGILLYSEGNIEQAINLGVSVTVQAAPAKWWSLTGQAVFNHKELTGFVWDEYRSTINQFNLNINNQFRIGDTYAAELSGFYTSRARNDLQEVLYPTGQVSAGVSRPVLKKKGSLKLSIRDIFYTQAMEGITDFENAEEYFILTRDSRIINIAFTYRFGKSLKPVQRNGGSAADEIQRVGNGN
jgi:outer membrane receptor protein involved in Fe transport